MYVRVCNRLRLCCEVVVCLLQYVLPVDELVNLTELIARKQSTLQVHAVLTVHV